MTMRSLNAHELMVTFAAGVLVLAIAGFWWGALTIVVVGLLIALLVPSA